MFCFHAEKNGCLPDYIPDSSSRQRKVESPGDEDKFTYIAVLLYMEQGMGQRLAYFPCFGAFFSRILSAVYLSFVPERILTSYPIC